MTAVAPFVCSWTNVGTSTQPAYQLTGSYKIVASFQGVASQPVYVGVASQGGGRSKWHLRTIDRLKHLEMTVSFYSPEQTGPEIGALCFVLRLDSKKQC